MARISIFKKLPDNWDVLLGKKAPFLQSSRWANLEQEVGAVPHYLLIGHPERPYGLCLLLEKRVKPAWWPFAFPYLVQLECTAGPVVLESGKKELVVRSVINWVWRYSRFRMIKQIKFNDFSSRIKENGLHYPFLKMRRSCETFQWATYLVDLTKSESDIFASLKHVTRNRIRKCLKQRVHVEKILDEASLLSKFSSPYFYSKGEPINHSTFLTKWQKASDIYHFFVVKDKNHNILAVLAMYVYNGTATEIASALAPLSFEKKIPAQDLLHWEMMKVAKKLGCHTFDLAGFNPCPRTKKEEGIAKFKGKWGGVIKTYGNLTLYPHPVLHKILVMIRQLAIRTASLNQP